MTMQFIKFPRTYHLMCFDSELARGDKLVSPIEAEKFFTTPVQIEEKVDGANLGFSLGNEGDILIQNRGNYISPSSHSQYKKLNRWVSSHMDEILEILFHDFVIFGEWCYAFHSIPYDQLPDWFLVFDIYSIKDGRFISRDRRHDIIKQTKLKEVPYLGKEIISPKSLFKMLESKSVLYNGPVEGLYLRIDGEDGYLIDRAKVVRPSFIQSIEQHWSKQELVPNKLISEIDGLL